MNCFSAMHVFTVLCEIPDVPFLLLLFFFSSQDVVPSGNDSGPDLYELPRVTCGGRHCPQYHSVHMCTIPDAVWLSCTSD